MMPHITLNGTDFPIKPEPPKSGAMLAIAAAEKSVDATKAMAYFYKLITSIIVADVPTSDVDDAMWDMDVEDIAKALEAATRTYGVDPSSAGPASSENSSAGSETGAPTSRVVSFSKGTVLAS